MTEVVTVLTLRFNSVVLHGYSAILRGAALHYVLSSQGVSTVVSDSIVVSRSLKIDSPGIAELSSSSAAKRTECGAGGASSNGSGMGISGGNGGTTSMGLKLS